MSATISIGGINQITIQVTSRITGTTQATIPQTTITGEQDRTNVLTAIPIMAITMATTLTRITSTTAVSYTHLDVYKRQQLVRLNLGNY